MVSSSTSKTKWSAARRYKIVHLIPVESTAARSVLRGSILRKTNAKSVIWQVARSAPHQNSVQSVHQISCPCRRTALVAVTLRTASSLTWPKIDMDHAHAKMDTGSLSLDVRLAKTSYPVVSSATGQLQTRRFHCMKVQMLAGTHANTTLTAASAPTMTSDSERMCHRTWSHNAWPALPNGTDVATVELTEIAVRSA